MLINFFEENNEFYKSRFLLSKNITLETLKFDINIDEMKNLKKTNGILFEEKDKNIKNRNHNQVGKYFLKILENFDIKEENYSEIANKDCKDVSNVIEDINKLKILINHQKKMNENKKYDENVKKNIEDINKKVEVIFSNNQLYQDKIDEFKKRLNNINKN